MTTSGTRGIESGGTVETARRTREIVGQVFRCAVSTGRSTSDPTRDLKGSLPLVPLSRQAVTILLELHPLSGSRQFVFPSARAGVRPMSDMAFSTALATMGFKDIQTAHGFRATARTILEERLKFRPEIVEAQLAHTVKDALGRA